MKIKLIENGLDSLKKGFEYLSQYEEKCLLEKSGNERYLILKDAILSIHHGIEILFKEVLRRSNELLIYSEIDKNLKNAFVEKRQRKLDSLSETKQVLHTVTFREAVDRVQKICGYEINNTFTKKLEKIENYRNQITHSEVALDETEVNYIFDGLIDEVDTFFMRSIGKEYSTVTGYAKLIENYKGYLEKLKITKQEIKREATEKFLEAFNKCSISMGENEVKMITNINTATDLISTLYDSNLRFGADFYDLSCSGDVRQIRRIENNRFAFFTKDNNAEYWMKFNSLLIYMPKVSEDFSPIIFFEADNDEVSDDLKRYVCKNMENRAQIEGIKFIEEDRIEWRDEEIHDFYSRVEYDEYFVIPEHLMIRHHLSKGIFCFVNVQTLNFGNMRKLLRDFGDKSLKRIEVMLRKALKKG